MGMEFVYLGTLQGHLRNLANNNNSGASIRILSKLFCELSYVTARYVVDS